MEKEDVPKPRPMTLLFSPTSIKLVTYWHLPENLLLDQCASGDWQCGAAIPSLTIDWLS
jgi:hypothetical protein